MKHLESDIVVIGAGTTGLPAAITAAEGGAKVILLEKRGVVGGAANMANMVLGIESRLQKAHPPVLTIERAFRDHLDWSHWLVDTKLVKAFYEKSASTIDWLLDMGVEFNPIGTYSPGNYNTTHVVKAPDVISKKNVYLTSGSCAAMIKILHKKAQELGVEILLKTPAKKLIKKNGRITGVVAADASGEEIRIKAKAVIIGSGGYSDNPQMIKQYTGLEEGKDLFTIKILGVKGDGIKMAWEAGAAKTDMHMQLMHHLAPPCQGPGGTAPELNVFQRPSNIMVNLLGERFIPEDLRGGHQSVGNAISIQKDRAAFMLFDRNLKKEHEKTKPRIGSTALLERPSVFKHDNLDDNIRDIQARGYKWLYMAETLEELCEQTGIDLKGLKQTIKQYNDFCKAGQDKQFYKDPQYLKPIKGPGYYACRFFLGAYGGIGGIKINHKTEVLDKDWKVIPGLYAGGNDANDLYGSTYVPLASNYMGFAVNTGRMAAERALEYIKSEGA